MIWSSPHVHTQFCDGASTAREMAEAALAQGFSSLGLSSHARQHFDARYSMDAARERAYISEVRALQAAYAGRLRVWLGIERDLFSCADRAPFDYVIGSVHYLPGAAGFTAVDGSADKLRRFCAEAYAGDGLALARAYYRAYAGYMRAYRPEIAGHIDLIRKNNANGAFFDEASPAYRDAAYQALCAAREAGAVLEVNTGGMARYRTKTPYPARFLLEAWRDMGGRVILSSDCHDARHIAAGYGAAIALLRDAGFESALALGTGDTLFEETPLEDERLQ